jgi:hypothetical protein
VWSPPSFVFLLFPYGLYLLPPDLSLSLLFFIVFNAVDQHAHEMLLLYGNSDAPAEQHLLQKQNVQLGKVVRMAFLLPDKND